MINRLSFICYCFFSIARCRPISPMQCRFGFRFRKSNVNIFLRPMHFIFSSEWKMLRCGSFCSSKKQQRAVTDSVTLMDKRQYATRRKKKSNSHHIYGLIFSSAIDGSWKYDFFGQKFIKNVIRFPFIVLVIFVLHLYLICARFASKRFEPLSD